jgi:replicative DNA helicase
MLIQREIDGRLSAPDAERGLLGVMLLDSKAIEAASVLRPADFSLDTHRRIFTTICRMHADGSRVDEVLLTEELKRAREYEAVGGAVAVPSLTDRVCRVRDVSGYVELIKEKSLVRRIFNRCELIQSKAIDGEDSSTLLHDLQTAVLPHQADDYDLRPIPITELVVPFLDKIRQERERPDELRGIFYRDP